MIYKDKYGDRDTAAQPFARIVPAGEEPCVNCAHGISEHAGWVCTVLVTPGTATYTHFTSLEAHKRYLTRSMYESLVGPQDSYNFWGKLVAWLRTPEASGLAPEVTEAAPPVSKSNSLYDPLTWRDFRNKSPGECLCEGTRGVCIYHP